MIFWSGRHQRRPVLRDFLSCPLHLLDACIRAIAQYRGWSNPVSKQAGAPCYSKQRNTEARNCHHRKAQHGLAFMLTISEKAHEALPFPYASTGVQPPSAPHDCGDEPGDATVLRSRRRCLALHLSRSWQMDPILPGKPSSWARPRGRPWTKPSGSSTSSLSRTDLVRRIEVQNVFTRSVRRLSLHTPIGGERFSRPYGWNCTHIQRKSDPRNGLRPIPTSPNEPSSASKSQGRA